jgi:hypothetical protein
MGYRFGRLPKQPNYSIGGLQPGKLRVKYREKAPNQGRDGREINFSFTVRKTIVVFLPALGAKFSRFSFLGAFLLPKPDK